MRSNQEQLLISFGNSTKEINWLLKELEKSVTKRNSKEINEILFCCENEVEEMRIIFKLFPIKEQE